MKARIVFLIVVTGLVFPAATFAQSNIYRKLQSPFYDSSPPVESCSENTELVGSNNSEQAYNFFVEKGFTPFQSAAIVGNMIYESGVEPQRLQGVYDRKVPAETLSTGQLNDANLGWGIVQFTPPKKIVENVTPKQKANDLEVQLDFIWNQLQSQGPAAESKDILASIKATTSITEAVLAFQGNTKAGGKYVGYLRPYDQGASVIKRTAAAKEVLNKYGSNSLSSSSSTACTTNSEGEVTGEYSLPVDKQWYTKYKNWFTKPHHDYPAADLPVPTGTPIYSMTGGIITSAPAGGGCGQGVVIKGDDGAEYVYCHGSDGGAITGAKKGDRVKAGQLIMRSASTGNSTGPHLHLGIKIKNNRYCPQTLLVGIAEGNIPNVASLPTNGCTY